MCKKKYSQSILTTALMTILLVLGLSLANSSYATIDDSNRWKPDEPNFYVENLVSEGVTHDKAILSWDKNDRAAGYIVYSVSRLYIKGSTNGTVYYHMSEKKRIDDPDITSVTFKGESAFDDMGPMRLTVVPYYIRNSQTIEGNARYAVDVKPLDYNKEKYQEDNTTPIIHNIELITSGTISDMCAIRMKVDIDGTGSKIKKIKTQIRDMTTNTKTGNEDWYGYRGNEVEARFYWESSKSNENLQREIAMIPIDDEDQGCPSALTGYYNRIPWIEVTDCGGNTAYWMGDIAYTDFQYQKEFDIYFTGKLSNSVMAKELREMDEGKTIKLTVDESSKGILKKELLDAIAGQDKTLVVYLNEKGTMQWVINGKDIKEETKNIDLNVKLSVIEGKTYDTTGKLIQLTFANNGLLPGQINFRLKSAYLSTFYDAEATYLYYKNSSNALELEDANCRIVSDGSGLFCSFNINHNSTFILSGKRITNSLKGKTITQSASSFKYDGENHVPTVTIKNGKAVLREGVDYTMTQENSIDVGEYKIRLEGIGNYEGSRTVSYKIVPKGTSISKLSKAKKAFTVKWAEQSELMSSSNITGYQIQYSTSKSFKSGNKSVKIKGYDKTSKKISKLKAKKNTTFALEHIKALAELHITQVGVARSR